MNGKIVKLNDFKLTYGKDTVFVNIYAAFTNVKNGNKYVIYSYDNTKLYYGSLFVRSNEIVVMGIKEGEKNVISEFIDEYLNERLSDQFKFISLNDIETIQIIEESVLDSNVDINKIYDLSIPKLNTLEENIVKDKKNISISAIFFVIFLFVVAAFFFLNPEVIKGKNHKYICNRSYEHDELPANVNEEVELIFTNKNIIDTIKITADYDFTDIDYYSEFKEKSYSYKYFKGNSGIKENSDKYSYRVFYDIDTKTDYFLPTDKDELVSYYEKDGYKCSEVEME